MASEFRYITCFSTLYKLISILLILRFQKGIAYVINPSWEGFIAGRQLIENVLLATELVKGYGKEQMLPRCLIKIYLRTAYDLVEWLFPRSMTLTIGSHEVYVRLVMECVSQYPILLC